MTAYGGIVWTPGGNETCGNERYYRKRYRHKMKQLLKLEY